MIHKIGKKEYLDVLEYLQKYNDRHKELYVSLTDSLSNPKVLEKYFRLFKNGEEVWGDKEFGYVFTFGLSNKHSCKELKVVTNTFDYTKLNHIVNNLCSRFSKHSFYIRVSCNNYKLQKLLKIAKCTICKREGNFLVFTRKATA